MLRLILCLLALVEFEPGTEVHKSVTFLFIYYFFFFFLFFLILLARQVFPQALTSFIYYSFSSQDEKLEIFIHRILFFKKFFPRVRDMLNG